MPEDLLPGTALTSAARFAFMIGHPVAHTAMPTCVNEMATRAGADLVMVPLSVPALALRQVMETVRFGENVSGAVVTAPHKQAAAALMDRLTPRAALLGLVNVVWLEDSKLVGGNVDGAGFLAAARDNGFCPTGAKCLIFGSGGAGASISAELSEAGAACIHITDPDAGKAAAISDKLGPRVEAIEAPQSVTQYDLVVNATGVGLDGRSLVHGLSGLGTKTLVADVLSGDTPFLQLARSLDAPIQDGVAMASAQIPLVLSYLGWQHIARDYGKP